MKRADRERVAYDSGVIKRIRYEKMFQRSFYDTQSLNSVITQKMKYADAKEVLELGSSSWIGYLHLKQIRPRKLICINISERELDIGLRYYKNNNIEFPVEFYLMDATSPAFNSCQFDLVFGGAILHHLDLNIAIKNISKICKPQGRILFHEPLGANPVAKIIRKLTPYARTTDEQPLSMEDIRRISSFFECHNYFSGFTSTIAAIFTAHLAKRTDTIIDRWANATDKVLASKLPTVSYFFRDIIIDGKRNDA